MLNTLHENYINTSVDSIYLCQALNPDAWYKITTIQHNHLRNYIVFPKYISDKEYHLYVRVKPYRKNFMIMKFFDGIREKKIHRHSFNMRVKIDIHLNTFLYQRYRMKGFVQPSVITRELESIVSHYTFIPLKLNKMKVSQVDIAADVLTKHDPYYYQKILSYIPYPYKILHRNSNCTLTIHSKKTIPSIDSNEDTPRIASIYDKYHHYFEQHDVELPRHLLRFEYKFRNRDKNEKIILDDGGTGITAFRHIFKADLASIMKSVLFEGWIDFFQDLNLSDEISRCTYALQANKHINSFNSLIEYYERRSALDVEMKLISSEIDRQRNEWVENLASDLTPEIKTLLWEKISKNLTKYCSPTDDTNNIILTLKEGYVRSSSIRTFLNSIQEFISCKLKFAQHIKKSLAKIYNQLHKQQIQDTKRETANKIKKLDRDFKNYNKHHFIKQARETIQNSNDTGFDLYRELCVKVAKLKGHEKSLGVQNTYMMYQMMPQEEILPHTKRDLLRELKQLLKKN